MGSIRAVARLSAVTVAAAIGLAACGSIAPGNGGAIRVVAAENFYGDLTQQIGGDRVQVVSILSDPSIDPHEYESNTQDALAVARAQLVIENGAGYDTFIDHLMSASPSSSRKVINVAHDFAIPAGANPHMWYSPRLLGQVADRIANQLGTIDPANQGRFHGGAQTFHQNYQPVADRVAEVRVRFNGASVLPTEQVADYLLKEAGLKPLHGPFQQAVEEGNDPPAQSVQNFQQLLSTRSVRILIYNQQTVSALTERMRQLAQAAGIPVVGVRETMPPGGHVQDWMLRTVTAVEDALSKTT
jgi:zinc/manganese transport system substrate-binding protein